MAHQSDPRPVKPERKPDTRGVKELRESRNKLEIQVAEKRLRIEEQLLENLLLYDEFGGSDLYFEMRTGGAQHWMPPSVPSDRRHGSQWPIWRWDQELDRFRNESRILCEKNSYARGLLENDTNYVIGKGFSYKAKAAEDLPDEWAGKEETLKAFSKATQRVVNDFLKRNRWNGLCDPREQFAKPTGTRERESYRRNERDGEALIRFFFNDDGTTDTRFMEPEQLRNPGRGPDGEPGTQQYGWSYGIRHKMNPEDTEIAEWYHFVFQDLSAESTGQVAATKRDAVGEFVPAKEIVHIKNPDSDMAIKRGLPAYRFDTAEALIRAAKLQKFISHSAAVRAATAEVWKHSMGTQAQISQLAQGFPSRTQLDAVTQAPEQLQRMYPGMIRRVPAGQEPVMMPENNATTQQQLACQGDLRQAGAAFAAPEYLSSGDASNANFSSTKEAGAPYVNRAEARQEHFKGAFLVCIWKAIRWAIECEKLPAEVLDVIEIQVEAPMVSHTDDLAKAQEDQILHGLGKSPQTIMMERGLDPEQEMGNTEEYQERMGQLSAPLAMPDENGNLPGNSSKAAA